MMSEDGNDLKHFTTRLDGLLSDVYSTLDDIQQVLFERVVASRIASFVAARQEQEKKALHAKTSADGSNRKNGVQKRWGSGWGRGRQNVVSSNALDADDDTTGRTAGDAQKEPDAHEATFDEEDSNEEDSNEEDSSDEAEAHAAHARAEMRIAASSQRSIAAASGLLKMFGGISMAPVEAQESGLDEAHTHR